MQGFERCHVCKLHRRLCLCGLVPSLDLRTRLVLILHKNEDKKTSSTGRLAARCLSNSSVIVRGLPGAQPSSEPLWPEGSLPLLLFPGSSKGSLQEWAEISMQEARPISLIVPDGTWRQAKHIVRRVPELQDVPRVGLPAGLSTTYRLRYDPTPGYLGTIEAIARAMGILEGPKVQTDLERVFRIMVERTLWSRGTLSASQVTDGLPGFSI